MSSGLDWERFGVTTGGDEVCILPPPTLSEKGVGIPTLSITQTEKFFKLVLMTTQHTHLFRGGTVVINLLRMPWCGSGRGMFRNTLGHPQAVIHDTFADSFTGK